MYEGERGRRREIGVRERERDERIGEGEREREREPAIEERLRRPGGVRERENDGDRFRGGERNLRGGEREPLEDAIDADLLRRGGEGEYLRPRP